MRYLNFAVIGGGNMGFRHMQSFQNSKYKGEFKVFWIDHKFQDDGIKLESACSFTDLDLELCSDLSCLKEKIDLLIICVGARSQVNVIVSILNFVDVDLVIFEKNLCQSLQDLDLLREMDLHSYVNLNLPQYPVIKFFMAQELEPLNIEVNGDLSFSGNSIHYLYLFSKMFNTGSCKLILSDTSSWTSTKRAYCNDLNGTLNALFSKEKSGVIYSRNESQEYESIRIKFTDLKYGFHEIDLTHNTYTFSNYMKSFEGYTQSGNGHFVIDDLIENRLTCLLPKTQEIIPLQRQIIEVFGGDLYAGKLSQNHIVPLM